MGYKDKEKQLAYVRKWLADRRSKWLKDNGPCVDCGSSEELEVDHEDPSTKVSHRVWSWSETRRLSELSKCRVRCRKCHRAKTTKYIKLIFTKPIKHGTLSGYSKKKCRCEACRSFYRQYRKDKYLRQGN